jgi:hypothetical protein
MSVDLHKNPQGNVCLIEYNSAIRPTFVNEMIIKIRQVVAMLNSVSDTTLMSEMLLLVMIYRRTSAAEASSIIPIAKKRVAYVPSTELQQQIRQSSKIRWRYGHSNGTVVSCRKGRPSRGITIHR